MNSETLDQNRAPIYEAPKTFRDMRIVPFDVPGHKHGRRNPELTEFLGKSCVSIDVNSMKPLDNLCHPVSVIHEAELLAADAFGAAHAFLMVGGTTSSVQSMVLSTCKRGDKIILPRNVHRSIINALVICGAIPVYVNPEVDTRLGISLGMQKEQVAKAISEHPDAVAVLVNNPTYYGICSDLRTIVKMAHDAGMYCLADEAHGTHFYFGDNMPVSAMAAGADMAAVSMHKSGGSLTQSSLLLTGERVNAGHVRQIINLTQTTSGSYLLMSSLDIRRRYQKDPNGLLSQEYIDPMVITSPQEAFYSKKKSLPIMGSAGYVCSEFVMCYPPGIPILAPGERITKEILDYIAFAKAKGCSMTGPEDPSIEHLNVLA